MPLSWDFFSSKRIFPLNLKPCQLRRSIPVGNDFEVQMNVNLFEYVSVNLAVQRNQLVMLMISIRLVTEIRDLDHSILINVSNNDNNKYDRHDPEAWDFGNGNCRKKRQRFNLNDKFSTFAHTIQKTLHDDDYDHLVESHIYTRCCLQHM